MNMFVRIVEKLSMCFARSKMQIHPFHVSLVKVMTQSANSQPATRTRLEEIRQQHLAEAVVDAVVVRADLATIS